MQGRLSVESLFRLTSCARMLSKQRAMLAGVLAALFAVSSVLTASAQSLPAGAGLIAYNKPGKIYGDELWLIHSDGSGDTQVPISDCAQCPLLGASHPTWSRDGRFIAVTGLQQGMNIGGCCYSYNLAGGYGLFYFDKSNPTTTLKRIAALGTLYAAGWSAFSPDGSRIAYSDVGPNATDYHVVNLDGTNNVEITPGLGATGSFSWGLDWSPTDANTLVLSLADPWSVAGNMRLALVRPVSNGACTVSPCSNQPRVLTQPPNNLAAIDYDMLPAFSPNGQVVAFQRYVDNMLYGVTWGEIRTINASNPGDGQGQLLLQLPYGYIASNLSWSADGSSLVFDIMSPLSALFGQGAQGLWTCRVSNCSATATRITGAPAHSPAWAWH